MLEDPSPLFVVFELIEAGAGRRQQDHVTATAWVAAWSTAASRVPARIDFGDAGNLPFDFFRRGADGVNRFDPLPQQSIQLGVVGVLVLASQDQVNITRERRDRLGRGVDVGSLGIVVVIDAVDGSHEFQAMLDRVERRDRAGDGLGGYVGHAGGANGSQHILDIVLAFERNPGQRKHRDRVASAPTRRNITMPFMTKAPLRTILLRLNQKIWERARLAACWATGSSPLRIRKSSAVWLAKIFSFIAR